MKEYTLFYIMAKLIKESTSTHLKIPNVCAEKAKREAQTDLDELLAKPSVALSVLAAQRRVHLLIHASHLLLGEGWLLQFISHTFPPVLHELNISAESSKERLQMDKLYHLP